MQEALRTIFMNIKNMSNLEKKKPRKQKSILKTKLLVQSLQSLNKKKGSHDS